MQINMQTQADVDAANEKKRKSEREAEILAELDEIDKKKIRPLTAYMLKTETKEDARILKELDDKARLLREEKRILEGE